MLPLEGIRILELTRAMYGFMDVVVLDDIR